MVLLRRFDHTIQVPWRDFMHLDQPESEAIAFADAPLELSYICDRLYGVSCT
jgi:hypothetical protein